MALLTRWEKAAIFGSALLALGSVIGLTATLPFYSESGGEVWIALTDDWEEIGSGSLVQGLNEIELPLDYASEDGYDVVIGTPLAARYYVDNIGGTEVGGWALDLFNYGARDAGLIYPVWKWFWIGSDGLGGWDNDGQLVGSWGDEYAVLDFGFSTTLPGIEQSAEYVRGLGASAAGLLGGLVAVTADGVTFDFLKVSGILLSALVFVVGSAVALALGLWGGRKVLLWIMGLAWVRRSRKGAP